MDKEVGTAHLAAALYQSWPNTDTTRVHRRLPSLQYNFIQKKAMIVLSREMKKNHSLTHFEIGVRYVRQQSDGQPMTVRANTVDLIHDPSG